MDAMLAKSLNPNKIALSAWIADNSARMSTSHPPFSLSTLFWVMYLVLAVVFVQGVRLHLHAYVHEPVKANHIHQDQVHTDYSTFDEQHADEMVEIDLTSQSILKKFVLGSLIIALLAVIVVLLTRVANRCGVWRPDHRTLFTPWRGCQPPPLRAPPLTGLK